MAHRPPGARRATKQIIGGQRSLWGRAAHPMRGTFRWCRRQPRTA